jgi:hypothetical protein
VPGSLGHLAKRFFDFLFSRPLTPEQSRKVESWLTPAEARLFFDQGPKDQAHGFMAGMYVWDRAPERIDLIRAAALHDVAKRHAHLGAVGRSITSIAIKARLPLTGRMRRYRDHPESGAGELKAVGSSGIIVAFAAAHHASRPGEISPDDWKLLVAADEPPKPLVRRHPG